MTVWVVLGDSTTRIDRVPELSAWVWIEGVGKTRRVAEEIVAFGRENDPSASFKIYEVEVQSA